MILNYIVSALLSMVQAIMSILPNVASTPTAIVDGGSWIISQISNVVGVLTMIFSAPLLTACVVVMVGMFTFEWIYHSVMWIVRKIPVINMK